MKKSILTSIMLISLSTIGIVSNAQGIAFNPKIVTPVNPHPESRKSTTNEMNVNINAVRDFRKDFKNATDIKWVQSETGASVYFSNDGIKMRSSYNTRGAKEYTLKYYDEGKMPSDLRQRVRSNYYDHNISIVTEVERHNQTFYLVKMENENEYLTVKIADDEMSVFEKTTKTK